MVLPLIPMIVTAVKAAVTAMATALPKIGAAALNLVNKIPPNLWKPAIELTTNLAKNLFDIKESAGEIGQKALTAAENGVDRDQFDSTAEYLKHLREKIKLDREKFDSLPPEELKARELTGMVIFTQSIEEKCGLQLPVDVLKTFAKIAMPGGLFLIMAEKLKNSNLTLEDIAKYLGENCPSSKIREIGSLLKDAVGAFLGANATTDSINQTILDMIEKNKQVQA